MLVSWLEKNGNIAERSEKWAELHVRQKGYKRATNAVMFWEME